MAKKSDNKMAMFTYEEFQFILMAVSRIKEFCETSEFPEGSIITKEYTVGMYNTIEHKLNDAINK